MSIDPINLDMPKTSKKRKIMENSNWRRGESYDEYTVRILVNCMKYIGYGVNCDEHRSIKFVFEATVLQANEKHGFNCSAEG